jgi:hypothetical protein
MIDHQVNASSSLAAAGTTGGVSPDSGETGDVSHLRPLSEGVLRAAGLHGGVDAAGKVIDLRGRNRGAIDIDPETLVGDEPHVRKQKLEHQTQGIIERNVNADGSVTLRLIHGEGDSTTAKAATTEEALDALISKVGGTN